MRVAIRIAYEGAPFAGSQRQPDQRTVEGELLRGLVKIGIIVSPEASTFQCASRTDRGVSAAGNVIALDTGFRVDALLPALGASVEDVWPWALAEVPEGFDARRARRRTYAYFLPAEAGLDLDRMREALQQFVGEHDFRSFARIEPGVDPVRRVTRVEVHEGAMVRIIVEGESFLWNQVRRMVEASRRVAAGEASLEDIDRGLGGERVDLGLAPASGLVLLDVDHGLAWRSHPATREAALAELGARLAGLRLREDVMGTLRGAIDAGAR